MAELVALRNQAIVLQRYLKGAPDEPREFVMGRAPDPWRAPATWIRCLASHSVPLHATAEPSAQTWHTFLRNQAFAISTIGLGEAGRLLDELLALVRGWIELVVQCVTKVRDRIPCGFMERSSTLHPVPPYRSSNLTDWRTLIMVPRRSLRRSPL
jgi:hypothetical protein